MEMRICDRKPMPIKLKAQSFTPPVEPVYAHGTILWLGPKENGPIGPVILCILKRFTNVVVCICKL
jgi:hypothetical protein